MRLRIHAPLAACRHCSLSNRRLTAPYALFERLFQPEAACGGIDLNHSFLTNRHLHRDGATRVEYCAVLPAASFPSGKLIAFES